MRKSQLDKIRRNLLQSREELLTTLRHRMKEAATLRDEEAADVADQGLTDRLKEFLHLLGDNQREEIVKIDKALERLDDGTFGVCEQCGVDIPMKRLEIRPYTRFCVDCKNTIEKEEKLKAGPGAGTL